MAEVNMAKAQEVFGTLCSMLDSKGWKYDKQEENLLIKSGVKGDDLPIEFFIRVNPKNEIVSFISALPFSVPSEKAIDVALAVCQTNYALADGSFDYDVVGGKIIFRLTSSYRESLLSEDLFEYMLIVSAGTIDEYNDKYFMITKNMLTIEKFLESFND